MSSRAQPSKGTILSVGTIPDLLSLREQVWRWEGYEVFSTTIPQQADFRIGQGGCALLLLCYSLSDDWRKRLIENFRAVCPQGRIVAITNHPLAESAKDVDALVHGIEGPEILLNALSGKAA